MKQVLLEILYLENQQYAKQKKDMEIRVMKGKLEMMKRLCAAAHLKKMENMNDELQLQKKKKKKGKIKRKKRICMNISGITSNMLTKKWRWR